MGAGAFAGRMAHSPRILAFSGSARQASLNRRLLAHAVHATRNAGGEVTLLDLNDYALPLYHGDLEDAEQAARPARRQAKPTADRRSIGCCSSTCVSTIPRRRRCCR